MSRGSIKKNANDERYEQWKSMPNRNEFSLLRNEIITAKGKIYPPFIRKRTEVYRTVYGKPWHETIASDMKLKLGGDIDRKNPPPGIDYKAKLEHFLSVVVKTCVETFGESPGDVTLFDSSVPHKYSMHFTFQRWFDCPASVRAFLEPLAPLLLPLELDLGIYPSSGIKSLRLPYCAKTDEPSRILLPVGHPPEFNLELFKLGCMTSTLVDPPLEECWSMDVQPGGDRKRIATGDPMSERQEKIVNYLILCYGKMDENGIGHSDIYKFKDYNGGFSFEAKPFFCEKRAKRKGDGFHESTERMFVGSDGTKVYLSCPDTQCKGRVYLHEDFGHL